MKSVGTKKLLGLALAVILLLGAVSIPGTYFAQASGDSTSDSTGKESNARPVLNSFNQNSYIGYLARYNDAPLPQTKILLKGASYISSKDANIEKLGAYQGTNDVLMWKDEGGTLKWSLDIEESGLYTVGIRYLPLSSGNEKIELQMKVETKQGDYLLRNHYKISLI
jgi:hypothetical protein